MWQKYLRKTVPFAILALAPAVAYGGLLDWLGLGKVAEVTRDITIAIVLKQFLDHYMPLIAVLIVAGFSVGCLHGARLAAADFSADFQSANKDGNLSMAEKLYLIARYPMAVVLSLALIWFGGLFGYMASDAALQLINASPPQ